MKKKKTFYIAYWHRIFCRTFFSFWLESQKGQNDFQVCPPKSFCNEVFGGFDETTFKQYILVGPTQKETVISSKFWILKTFEILIGTLGKNPVVT